MIFTYTPSVLMFLGYVYSQDVVENLWTTTARNKVTAYRLEFNFLSQARMFLSPTMFSSVCRSLSGYWGPFTKGKAAECEAGHSPQSSDGIKNLWNHTSTQPHDHVQNAPGQLYFIQKPILDTKIIAYFFITTPRSVY